MFSRDEVSFEIVDVEGSIAIVEITTPLGKVSICGQLVLAGRLLIASGVHVGGLSIGGLGRRGMNVIARKVMEVVDVDTIIVFGEARTTGARPGHRPRPIRFNRI